MRMVSGTQTNLVSVFLSAGPHPPRKLPFNGRLRERTKGDRFSLEEETWTLGEGGGVKGCGERVPGKAPAMEDPLAGRTSQEFAVARSVIS